MSTPRKVSLADALAALVPMPDRTPEMAFTGGMERAFAELATCGDGTVYVTWYSGDSEWERHRRGDELVLALAGSTTLVLLVDGREQRVGLGAMEFAVVPAGTWHRFVGSRDLQVLTVTPQPTDHARERPDG